VIYRRADGKTQLSVTAPEHPKCLSVNKKGTHEKDRSCYKCCHFDLLLIVGGKYLNNHLFPQPASKQVKANDVLSPLRGYAWKLHPHTLVLALKSGCHYCEDSAPFYQKLVELEKSGKLGDTHILAIFPDPPTVVNKVLQTEGLDLQSIPSVPFSDFNIPATPTAILVDAKGKVVRVWRGELPSAEERRLLEAISPKPGVL
jgi:hypothetical protein